MPPSAMEASSGSAKTRRPASALATARPDTATALPARTIAVSIDAATSSPAARCSRKRVTISNE